MAALLAGQHVNDVAKTYNLNPVTVRGWMARDVKAIHQAQAIVNGQSRIGDLIMEYLAVLLVAVMEMVKRVSQDPNWLLKQDASGVAVLIGVLTDKLVRIIEALPQPEDGGGDGALLAGGSRESEAA